MRLEPFIISQAGQNLSRIWSLLNHRKEIEQQWGRQLPDAGLSILQQELSVLKQNFSFLAARWAVVQCNHPDLQSKILSVFDPHVEVKDPISKTLMQPGPTKIPEQIVGRGQSGLNWPRASNWTRNVFMERPFCFYCQRSDLMCLCVCQVIPDASAWRGVGVPEESSFQTGTTVKEVHPGLWTHITIGKNRFEATNESFVFLLQCYSKRK